MKRWIALESCPGRIYGEEFSAPESAELTALLLSGKVRIDDRMTGLPRSQREAMARAAAHAAAAADPEIQRAEANLSADEGAEE